MTTSAKLISRVRGLAHAERIATGQANELQTAALDLADYLEIQVADTLRLERVIHDWIKRLEDADANLHP